MKYLLLLLLVSFAYSSDSYGWDDSVFPPDEEIPLSEKKSKPMVHQKKSNTSSGANSKKSGSNRVVATVNKSKNKNTEGYQNKKKATDKKAMQDYKDR